MTLIRALPFAALIAGFLAALSGPAEATEWNTIIRGHKPCQFSCTAEQKARDAAIVDGYEYTQSRIISTLTEIEVWMQAMGYRAPHFPTQPRNLMLIDRLAAGQDDATRRKWKFRLGEYDETLGMRLSYAEMGQNPESRARVLSDTDEAVLAHELYHATQRAHGDFGEYPLWVREGMASAVGYAWKPVDLGWPVTYDAPLHEPVNAYGRWHFFYHLGRDLGFAQGVDDFDTMERADRPDRDNGIGWLDAYLVRRGDRLSRAFPRFIARHAMDPGFYDAPQSGKIIAPNAEVPLDADGARDMRSFGVAPVAATLSLTRPAFLGDWFALPARRRVFVQSLSILKPNPDLHLVVDRRVLPGGQVHRRPVIAGPDQPTANVRVVNVAPEASQTRPVEDVTLVQALDRVTFDLPACLAPGQTLDVVADTTLDRDALQQAFLVPRAWLRTSAGRLTRDFQFTAPSSGEVVLVLDTGDGPATELARSMVNPGGCMVQMIIGEEGVMTYDPGVPMTEFADAASGSAVYFKPGDVAAWEGGWVPIPPEAKGMLLAGMEENLGQMVSVGNIEKEVDDWAIWKMPEVFSRRFGWDNLRSTGVRRSPASCPASAMKPCAKADFRIGPQQVSAIHDGAGRPVSVTLAEGATFTFRYGDFQLRRPPGW